MAVRLNIGCGDKQFDGWDNLDVKTGYDMRDSLPYADSSVDEIYCSHALEHIHHSHVGAILTEWRRVLKPGGRVRIAVPNHEDILARHKSGDMDIHMFESFMHGSVDGEDRHLGLYTAEKMAALLSICGFNQIGTFEPEFDDCSRLPVSLNLQATKRAFTIKPNPKVMFVLSIPRLAFTDALVSVIKTCSQTGWGIVEWGTSGDWHAALTYGMQSACKQGADYVVTVDYDSVFTPDDAMKLVQRMQDNPELSAIFPVQAHRHRDRPLSLAPEAKANDGVRLEKGVTRLHSGHFALSVIRTEIFAELPQPWFMALPDPNTGEWKGDHKLDADISFWMTLWRYGHVVAQDDTVQVGHMELCVKWCTETGIIWQPISHYKAHGKPDAAVFNRPFWEQHVTQGGLKSVPKPSSTFNPKELETIADLVAERLGRNGHIRSGLESADRNQPA